MTFTALQPNVSIISIAYLLRRNVSFSRCPLPQSIYGLQESFKIPRSTQYVRNCVFYSRREPVSPATLERATKSLYHRGPDGQRQWISRDSRVGLGHARLSIIDLATGDQPIASEDERTQIVVNGEFYGYEAIQRNLKRAAIGCAHGPTARSRCISTKNSARNACTGCAASLLS